MKLTAGVIKNAQLVINPDHKLLLQLRSLQALYIEGLEATNDVFQAIDLTNNELVELSGIPPDFCNLEVLLLANNNITSVAQELNGSIKTVSLINNNIGQMKDLEKLRHSKVEYLFLLGNPVTKHHFYRAFVVWLVPTLRVLDGEKVSAKERAAAVEQFGPDFDHLLPAALAILAGDEQPKEEASKKERLTKNVVTRLSKEEKEQLLKELEEAETEEDVERISAALSNG